MAISAKKEENLKAMPKIQTVIEKIPGKNVIVHRTIITDVKPIAYYNKVIENGD